MSKLKKNITVRFFTISAEAKFFKDFSANFLLGHESDSNSRIFSVRHSKYLIKTIKCENDKYFISVLKERNTWQAKATRDGLISGIDINQGIIGDPYYFCVLPSKKILFGFTTGPIGSLKSVAKVLLEQFNNNRLDKVNLSLIAKEKEYSKLHELPEFSSLHFKINSSSLIDVSEDAPDLIKNLSSAPYIDSNIQLSLDLECSDSDGSMITKNNLIEIVNYLSESDACTVLKVKGLDKDGYNVNLDFGNAFLSYKEELSVRNKYVDEPTSLKVLISALNSVTEF